MPPFRDVDEAYDRLRVTGQNSVENIVQWLKDAQVLEMLQKTEEDAKRLFENVRDKRNVTKEQFRNAMEGLDCDSITLEKIHYMLLAVSGKLFAAITAAGKAFLDSFQGSEDRSNYSKRNPFGFLQIEES